ncbi:MAG: ABC transporter ATP-binding protein [Pseudomonadota bacterium]
MPLRARLDGPALARDGAAPLLRIEGLSVRFGGIVALDAVSFAVAEGQICALIGPNGAGKTTLFNCLSRIYRVQAGQVYFAGRSLLEVPRHAVAAMGISRTFQNLALFETMTVLENVMVGAHGATSGGVLADGLRLPFAVRAERALRARAGALIDLLGLKEVAGRRASDLALGTRKRVELARALASRPRLLLLDEPAAGLNHEEVATLGALIRDIRDRHLVTILLVEHRIDLVMAIADQVVALDFGRKIAEGAPDAVRRHPAVIESYLGGAA